MPTEVAKYIMEIHELYGESKSQIASRLGVSEILIDNFLSLAKIPEKYHDLLGWGDANDGRIPWSWTRRVGKALDSGLINEAELGKLLNGIEKKEILPKTMEEIIYSRNRNKDITFDQCYKEISNGIPETINFIIFVAELEPIVVEDIHKNSQKLSIDRNVLAESLLSKRVGSENLNGVLIKDDCGIKIAFTEKGRRRLDEICLEENILLKDIINHILVKEMSENDQ
ncbi:MAG: hypothetical protein MPK62_02995 [Alphaproteobacteria bacterium]|nr:hypothetical protein [Alphaproteobacteria bacterium]